MIYERIMYFLIGLIGNLVIMAFTYSLFFASPEQLFRTNQEAFILLNVMIITVLLYCLKKYKIVRWQKPSWKELGILLLGVVAVYLTKWVEIFFFPVDIATSESTQNIMEIASRGFTVSFVTTAVILAPMLEEIFYRGFMQKGSFNHSRIGILISTGIFAFSHGVSSFSAFLVYFIPGLGIAYSYKLTDNFWVPMAFHILHNSFPLILLLMR